MKGFVKLAVAGLVVALAAACSNLGGAEGGSRATLGSQSGKVPQSQIAATVRVLPYTDERNMGNPRKIGTGAENLAGFSGLKGTDILLQQDVAVLVSGAMSAQLSGAGYRVVEQNPMYELSGTVKELTYNVKARDEVAILVESTLKETATGRVVWSGLVTERTNRFAGIVGNTMDDVNRVLKKELGIVTRKTVDAISAVLMAQRPELFNVVPGTKPIPGVTVLTAPGAASGVPVAPAASAGKGVLAISTEPARAEVYIDEVYYGLTPLRLDLEAGIHTLAVKQGGYKTKTEKVSVRQGETTEVRLKLAR